MNFVNNLFWIAGGIVVGAVGVIIVDAGASWASDGIANMLPNVCPFGFGQVKLEKPKRHFVTKVVTSEVDPLAEHRKEVGKQIPPEIDAIHDRLGIEKKCEHAC